MPRRFGSLVAVDQDNREIRDHIEGQVLAINFALIGTDQAQRNEVRSRLLERSANFDPLDRLVGRGADGIRRAGRLTVDFESKRRFRQVAHA